MFWRFRDRGIAAALLSLLFLAAHSGDLFAQTKPRRTEIGGEPPRSIMWVGNSFFYYNNNDALVIPSGLAFANVIAKRPDLELYQPDKRHPSLIGTYLSAATAYAAIYRNSPVGNKHTAGIDADTVKFLQTVAWETVQEYFGR